MRCAELEKHMKNMDEILNMSLHVYCQDTSHIYSGPISKNSHELDILKTLEMYETVQCFTASPQAYSRLSANLSLISFYEHRRTVTPIKTAPQPLSAMPVRNAIFRIRPNRR